MFSVTSDETVHEQLSIGPLRQSGQKGKQRSRCRCAELVRIPMGQDRELVYARHCNTARILPKLLVDAVSSCRSFKSLDEHAAFITGQLSANQHNLGSWLTMSLRSALPLSVSRLVERVSQYAQSESRNAKALQMDHLKQQLVELLHCGILVEESVTERSLLYSSVAPPKISVVGVVTCNRTKGLARCLRSFIDNNVRHERDVEYVVVDDSPGALERSETRKMLTALAGSYAVPVAYAGLEEKQAYCQELIRQASLPPEVVKFALFGMDGCGVLTGANRNALLLHNLGEMFLSADDDTVCRLAAMPHSQNGLAIDSRPSFFEFNYFKDRRDALHTVPETDVDVLALHEELLGRHPCALGPSKQPFNLNHCSPPLLVSLDQPNLKVAVTFTGMLGDSAMQMPVGNLRLSLASHQRLLAFNNDNNGGQNREVLRGVTRQAITDNIWCMSTALAYDNRELLPPFIPVQRNQDGVFGLTMRRCCEENLFGHIPWVLLHDPPEIRTYPNEVFWHKTRTSDCIAGCILSFNFPAPVHEPARRFQALGQHLMEIGLLPLREFEEFLRIQLWKLHSAYLSTMETHLRAYQDSSAVWAANLRNHLQNMTQAITEPDYIVPQSLLKGRTTENALKLLHTIVFKYGELLWWWPRIVQAARVSQKQLAAPLTAKARPYRERAAC